MSRASSIPSGIPQRQSNVAALRGIERIRLTGMRRGQRFSECRQAQVCQPELEDQDIETRRAESIDRGWPVGHRNHLVTSLPQGCQQALAIFRIGSDDQQVE
jgi:hypothetical protein